MAEDRGLLQTRQVAAPTVAAVLNGGALIEQRSTSPGTGHTAPDWTNVFFSVPLKKEGPKQFAFTWDTQEIAPPKLRSL